MKIELTNKLSVDDHLGCFGNFCMDDPVCSNFCALRIRCTIERDQNVQSEIFEDLVSGDYINTKIQ